MTGPPHAHTRSRELAATALDFALDPNDRAELDAHLAGCPACLAFGRALQRDHASIVALPAVDAPERVRRRVLGRPTGMASLRRPWVAPAVAVMVLVIAVTPLALRGLFSSSAGGTAPPSAAATTIPGGTSAPTAPASQAPEEGWAVAQIGDGPSASQGAFAGVVYVPGRGFAAVGQACPAGVAPGSCSALAATSADGARWTLAPDAPLRINPVDGQQAGMRAVTLGGPGVVAVGVTGDGNGRPRAGVWTSPYGRDWQRVADDPDFENAWMNAVTTTEDGMLVAVGGALAPSGGVDAAIWTSNDGSTWARGTAEADGALFAGALEFAHRGRPTAGLGAVAELPSGGLVGVGSRCETSDVPCAGAAWTSPDGLAWSATSSEVLAEGVPAAATSVGGTLVVVGRASDFAAAWSTADGTSWERVTGLPNEDVHELLAVSSTAGGIRAAGAPAELWASSDAVDWWVVAADVFEGDSIAGLASGAGGHVAVGSHASGSPAAWYGTPEPSP